MWPMVNTSKDRRPVAAKIETEQLRDRIMELAVACVPVAEIAEQLGYDRSWIYKCIKARLKDMAANSPATAFYRQHQRYQIHQLLRAWWPKAKTDKAAFDVVHKLLEQEAKLMGLYAPTRHDVQGQVTASMGPAPMITLDMDDKEASAAYAVILTEAAKQIEDASQ